MREKRAGPADLAARPGASNRDCRVLGERELANWAVVMAGGRGTRLSPLTDHVPKPMLSVAGRPILERLVLHLTGAGISRVFLSVNYLADVVEQHFGDGTEFGCRIEYLREDPDRPLGTGGPLRLLHEAGYRPAEPVVVMNGDLVTAFAVGEMLDAHVASGVVATIAASEHRHQVPFGVIEERHGQLRRIVEKPVSVWPVNAGIYVLEPVLLERIPPATLYPITRLFDECVRRGEPVGVWRLEGEWQDIGRPEELARARAAAHFEGAGKGR